MHTATAGGAESKVSGDASSSTTKKGSGKGERRRHDAGETLRRPRCPKSTKLSSNSGATKKDASPTSKKKVTNVAKKSKGGDSEKTTKESKREKHKKKKSKNCVVEPSKKLHSKSVKKKNEEQCKKKKKKKETVETESKIKKPKKGKNHGCVHVTKNKPTVSSDKTKQSFIKVRFPKEISIIRSPKKKMYGFWRGPRLRRIAGLNALAKVHILYENEARSGNSDSEKEEPMVKAEDKAGKKKPSSSKTDDKQSQESGKDGGGVMFRKHKLLSLTKKNESKMVKRPRLEVADGEVLTSKRMANLNAQAILAASYCIDKPRRTVKAELVSMEIVSSRKEESFVGIRCSETKTKKTKTKVNGDLVSGKKARKRSRSPDTSGPQKTSTTAKGNKEKSPTDEGKKETQPQKTTSEEDEKVEVKMERERTEKLEDTAEVTITGVYINPTTNASFCISRIQTYKQQSQNYSPPPSPPPSQGQAPPPVHLQPSAHLMGSVLHSATHLPSGIYPFTGSGSQSYALNGLSSVPVVNMALPRHYSSAFTVPHYGHHTSLPYTHGFYQPAGPLIQTITDPCLIHKPVPYHPHLQQAPPQLYSQERCPSHTTPPQALQCPHDQCPHPTPPYSSQPCTQSKCQASAPSPASHFSSESCLGHPPTQEGFFPDRCSTQPPQAYPHVAQPYQSTKAAYKSHPSTQYVDTTDHSKQHSCAKSSSQTGIQHKYEQQPKMSRSDEQTIATLKIVENQHRSGSNFPHQRKEHVPNKEEKVKTDGSSSSLKIHLKGSKDKVETKTNSNKQSDSVKVPQNSDSTKCQRQRMKLLRNVNNNRHFLHKKRHLDVESNEEDTVKKRRLSNTDKKLKGTIQRSKAAEDNGSPERTSRKNKIATSSSERNHPEVLKKCVNNEGYKVNKLCLHGKGNGKKGSSVTTINNNHSSNNNNNSVVPIARLPSRTKLLKKVPKYSNGWTWDGEPFDQPIQLHNDDQPVMRRCFSAMRHIEGDIIKIRDCVLLKSGPRKNDLPFVAKVAALWENPEDGEMMISLLWYYRPEHTEQGRKPHHMEDEIFASKHRDVNSVACIEDKCYVLTFNEYCRYRSRAKLLEESLRPKWSMVPDPEEGYPRKERQPPGRLSSDMVFFCRKVYDFRQKRILKNPS